MSKENKKDGGINMYNSIIKAKKSLVRDNEYNKKRIQQMYQYPANLTKASLHKIANRFGYNSKFLTDGKKAPFCPCCELPVNTVDIDLDYSTTPAQANIKAGAPKYLLNAGTSMFFTFIKMTIVYLGLRFFLTDGYNLITNIFADNCKDPKNISECSNNFAAKFSNFNKSTNQDEAYLFTVDILNIITVFISIIFFTLYRRYQYRIYSLADMSNHTQADYTIFVESIPILLPKISDNNRVSLDKCDYQDRLQQIFELKVREWMHKIQDQIQKNPNNPQLNKLQQSVLDLKRSHPNFEYQPIVTSITLCFDLTQLQKLNYLRQELMEKHKQNNSNNKEQDKNPQLNVPYQIQALNKEIIQLSRKFADQDSSSFNLSHFVGKGFVSFQYEHYKQYFLEYFQGEQEIKMLDKILKISPAAQPSDIYWYNMKVLNSQRTKSIIYSYLIMAVSLLVSFGILFGLEYYQLAQSTKSISTQLSEKTTKQVILSYSFTTLMTVLTTAINSLLSWVIQKLTDFEKQKTKTDQIISLITKTVCAQFLNTAVIYYIISIAASMFLPPEKNSPLSESGLVMKVTSLIAVSGFIQIMTNFVQFGQIYSSITNYCKYQKKDTANCFQVELNKNLQPTEFSFALRYSYYILNVYVVSFYSYIVPYLSLILIVIFLIQYWVDKYNLFKRFSCPTDFNYRLSTFTLKIFECSIFFFALGNLLFAPTIHTNSRGGEYRIINLVSVLLAVVYCIGVFFLPKKWLQKISHQTYELTSYQQCIKELFFNKVYWLQNPATTFAYEPNLNNPSQVVNYGQQLNFAKESDFSYIDDMIHQQNFKVDTYSPDEFNKFAAILVGQEIINNNDRADDDIISKLSAAAKRK